VDYERILRSAERDGNIILWDGGNNDMPFYRSDLEVVVLDAHRVGHELSYYPGEVNFRTADVLIINKVDSANGYELNQLREHCHQFNPHARVIEAASRIHVSDPAMLRGKRALIIEDGPTLTHGGMAYGAGVIGARNCGAEKLIDPRPYAVGSIRSTFDKFQQLTMVLPAMGYSEEQRHELEETIDRVPCDVVVVATPIDLAKIIHISKPSVRVTYEMEEVTHPNLGEILDQVTQKYRSAALEVAIV
jgi:predicted GTPase